MSRMSELDQHIQNVKEVMIENLEHEAKRINRLIVTIPSGPIRNNLCDAHIHMQAAIDLLKEPH